MVVSANWGSHVEYVRAIKALIFGTSKGIL